MIEVQYDVVGMHLMNSDLAHSAFSVGYVHDCPACSSDSGRASSDTDLKAAGFTGPYASSTDNLIRTESFTCNGAIRCSSPEGICPWP